MVPEIEMAGVLAAEDRAGIRHTGLDERVADAVTDRFAAALPDDLGNDTRARERVDHRVARMIFQDRARNHRGGGRPGDRVPRLIDEEHAVRVAVEGEAD